MGKKVFLSILFIFIYVTAFNLFKPVHIDDTAYLSHALHIIEEPLNPMGGSFNWDLDEQPFSYQTYPPLIPYIYAAVIFITGSVEFSTHVLMAFFSLSAIVLFYLITGYFIKNNRLFLTAVFFISPAFMPGQNVMLDVPILSTWLMFYFLVLKAGKDENFKTYLLASFVVLVACLTKYSSIVLIPAYLLILIYRRGYKYLITLLIPVVGLVLWSTWNYFDYGEIHILGRAVNKIRASLITKNAYVWTYFLGGLLPFSVAFITRLFDDKRVRNFSLTIFLFAAFTFFNRNRLELNYYTYINILRALFFANGMMIISVLIYKVLTPFLKSWRNRDDESDLKLTLTLWFFSGALFIIIFVPFMAARHLLFAMPPLIISFGYVIDFKTMRKSFVSAFIITLFLGTAVSVSDYQFASIYKTQARVLTERFKDNPAVWCVGHWGWQWYAKKNKMLQYDYGVSIIKKGDILLRAELPGQLIHPDDRKRIKRIELIEIPSNKLSFIRATSNELHKPGGQELTGYYSCTKNSCLPWYFSTTRIDAFEIYKVVR